MLLEIRSLDIFLFNSILKLISSTKTDQNSHDTTIVASFQLDNKIWEVEKAIENKSLFGYRSYTHFFKCTQNCTQPPDQEFFELSEVQNAGVKNLEKMLDRGELIVKYYNPNSSEGNNESQTDPIIFALAANEGGGGWLRISFLEFDQHHKRYLRYRYFLKSSDISIMRRKEVVEHWDTKFQQLFLKKQMK